MRFAIAWLVSASILPAQVAVTGKVQDENGVAVAAARVEFRSSAQDNPSIAISDTAGNFAAALSRPGDYQVRAERQGFFVFHSPAVALKEGGNQLTIVLNHLQEFAESVDVTYSPPAIDLQQPSDQKQLNQVEILAVPYPASQDLRKALPLMPGVLEDNMGRLHFNGGASNQTNYNLDGFNIADPVNGRFESKLNIESVRSLDLDSSRFSADKGRGSAGSLDVKTSMGDDRWRFSGTNFVPNITTEGGLRINKWTPRLQLSGPVVKGRAWFHNGFDTYYDVDYVHELPRGENTARSITTSNLTRFQVNLTPANILTGSVLLNYVDRHRQGLAFLNPVETTTDRRNTFSMASLRDQIYFSGGTLLEFGYADSRAVIRDSPQGHQTFEMLPWGKRGNYFVDLTVHTHRQQGVVSVVLPSLHAAGAHQFKFGADVQRTWFDQLANRHDYRVLRNDLSVARYVTFLGEGFLNKSNADISGYFQDRWSPMEGLLVELGLRMDWDQVVRDHCFSPRIAAAWAPRRLAETKFSAGYGVFFDALTLGTITRHQDQVSLSTFYYPNGELRRGPVETTFRVDEQRLRVPRYEALSLGVERTLPFGFYGKAGYLRRVGSRGFTFVHSEGIPVNPELEGGAYDLRNWRNDRYDALEFTLRRTFAGQFEWLGSYVRSRARSDAVLEYNLEEPIFARQAPGPLSWDSPNRLITWGWAPVPKSLLPGPLRRLAREVTVSYLVEYRSGFPFSTVNEEALLVGDPNSRRLPPYFSLNLHLEKKFRFFHYLWAWRFGFNNLTNNGNPNAVNNNVDSPTFLAYGRGQQRAFTVRLRLLGKR
ncbi:MAG: TonB-dependent receptor [Bryobacterales bacterium]|nr:TonB-dependent receptor [Bryobacterales bacterium]